MKLIFVFGSNIAGRHGAGSAKEAMRNWGAIYGQGVGRQGDAYAIPTKDKALKPLSLHDIQIHVDNFIEYAKTCPDDNFHVVRVGCGLAGYSDDDIAPLFKDAPANCDLPDGWRR